MPQFLHTLGFQRRLGTDNAPIKHQTPLSISQLRKPSTFIVSRAGGKDDKTSQRLAAPFVVSRGMVPNWAGWELGQETINKAHRSVRRHPPTFSWGLKVKPLLDFASPRWREEHVGSTPSSSWVSTVTALGKVLLLKETLLQGVMGSATRWRSGE